MKGKRWFSLLSVGLLPVLLVGFTRAQAPASTPLGTTFTYQGQLKQNGSPVNGVCDFQFSLWNELSGGNQIGLTQSPPPVGVTDGAFTVQLDFGSGAFQGDARWLEIAVCCPSGCDPKITLTPRQALTAAPYALALPGLWTQPDAISPNLIGGYSDNWVSDGVEGATIGGGGESGSPNRVTDHYGVVDGGGGNQAGNGDDATYDAMWATVGGGASNTAGGGWATVGGGASNTASDNAATVGGGFSNTASDYAATVGGGSVSTASGGWATVGGGYFNTASGGDATVGGGHFNTASGYAATAPGGASNLAQGDYSFAAGRRAKANSAGCFVWGDSTDSDVPCNDNNRWVARASGGVYFYTSSDLLAGVYIAAGGGAWSPVSDRALKDNVHPVDGRDVLARLAQVPVTTWNYKSQDPSIRHIGPMAQDFYAAFQVGEDDKHISTIDADGVALAAIQGLVAENQALRAQVASLDARLTALEQAVEASQPAQTGTPWLLAGGLVVAVGTLAGWRRRPGGGR